MTRCLLLVFLLVPRAVAGETSDHLFDDTTIHDIRLYIHSSDLALLRERYYENTHYPADVEWRGVRARNAGVRVRGLASRSHIKPSLQISFNHYVAGQKFLGMTELVLDNNLKDASMIREWASMAFIRRMGQPAPRESFARVYINGHYEGLYTAVEAIDAGFLDRALGDGLGYLFEHKFQGGFHAEDLGDDLNLYESRFEARTHRLESESTLYAPIQALFREVNRDVDGSWRERVGWFIDLQQFVRYVAIEMFLGEVDGFLGYAGMANFYLHRPVATNVHTLLAWDRDATFEDPRGAIFLRAHENALFSRAMMFADLRSLYLDTLLACADAAVRDLWLAREIERGHQLISDAVYGDRSKPWTDEAYDLGIEHLRRFAEIRPSFVREAVAEAQSNR